MDVVTAKHEIQASIGHVSTLRIDPSPLTEEFFTPLQDRRLKHRLAPDFVRRAVN